MMETLLENRVTPLTQFTLTPDNLTEAIIVEKETENMTKVEETTLEAISSSENSIGSSSEETSSEEETEDETTTFKTMKPLDEIVGEETKPAEESGEEVGEDEEEEEETTEAFTGNNAPNLSCHTMHVVTQTNC